MESGDRKGVSPGKLGLFFLSSSCRSLRLHGGWYVLK